MPELATYTKSILLWAILNIDCVVATQTIQVPILLGRVKVSDTTSKLRYLPTCRAQTVRHFQGRRKVFNKVDLVLCRNWAIQGHLGKGDGLLTQSKLPRAEIGLHDQK